MARIAVITLRRTLSATLLCAVFLAVLLVGASKAYARTGCYYSIEASRSYCYGNQGGGYSPSWRQELTGRGYYYHNRSGTLYVPNNGASIYDGYDSYSGYDSYDYGGYDSYGGYGYDGYGNYGF